MKIRNLFALAVIAIAPCLAIAQTPVAPNPATTATVPPGATPTPTPPGATAQGDTLTHPPEQSVIAHGTAPDVAPVTGVSLTNDPTTDDILDTVSFDAIPLTDAVKALALQAGINVQFDPKITSTVGPDGHTVAIAQPPITEKWKKVTAKQALTALLDNWGWQLVIDPHTPIARVTAKDPAALEPLVTSVVELEYSTPSNIVTELQPTLSQRSSIISDPRTHQLVLRTTERELPAVLSLITKLDSSTRQVLIEAKIIETTKDISSAKGVDWTGTLAGQHVSFGNGLTGGSTQYIKQSGTTPVTSGTTTLPGGESVPTTSGGGIGSVISNLTSLTTTIPGTTSQGGGISLNTARGFNPATAFLNADGVQAVLSFLNTDADTKSISFPRTVALDGVKTVLMVVQNVPIFEQSQSAPTAGAASGLETVLPNYDKEVQGTILNEVGVKLTVIPRIAGPTNVMMDLRPEISQQDAVVATDTLNGQVNTAPIFDRRSVVTQASVPTGYTLVLGGLESDLSTKNFTKVPFLGDLPGLGYAFRSDSKSRTRDTILIFVTPTIISDNDFQPANSTFLQRKGASVSNLEEPYYDTGKPYDWTKPKTGVSPAYEP